MHYIFVEVVLVLVLVFVTELSEVSLMYHVSYY